MKTTSLLIGTFLTILTGGCMSDSYGPASPDFYPGESPPFAWNSRPGLPAQGKVTAARSLPAAALPAPGVQMARTPDLPPAARS
ncbi:MAG: hypothetical protein ABSG78_07805 [Verrucomicrobiota bacterium]|jgi:hypothetical protein